MIIKLRLAAIGLVAVSAVAGCTGHPAKHAAPPRSQVSIQDDEAVTDPAANAALQQQFSGTGDGEGVSAPTSNTYVCSGNDQMAPRSSPMTKLAGEAAYAVGHEVAHLLLHGALVPRASHATEYAAATRAARLAAKELAAAHAVARQTVSLCNFVGLLQSGSSQLASLAHRLDRSQATASDIVAAVRYAQVLRQFGITSRPTA